MIGDTRKLALWQIYSHANILELSGYPLDQSAQITEQLGESLPEIQIPIIMALVLFWLQLFFFFFTQPLFASVSNRFFTVIVNEANKVPQTSILQTLSCKGCPDYGGLPLFPLCDFIVSWSRILIKGIPSYCKVLGDEQCGNDAFDSHIGSAMLPLIAMAIAVQTTERSSWLACETIQKSGLPSNTIRKQLSGSGYKVAWFQGVWLYRCLGPLVYDYIRVLLVWALRVCVAQWAFFWF